MGCKNCIHESVCSALIEKGLPWNNGEYPAEAFCMAFRNKADVVEEEDLKRKTVRTIFEEIDKITCRYLDDQDYSTGEMVYDIEKLKEKYIGE